MKGLLKLFLLIIAILVFMAGLAGFVPVLSTILGTNKPKDLGIKFTDADLAKAKEKAGVTVVELPKDTLPENSYSLSGQKAASFTLTSEEATAIIKADTCKYCAFSNVQLRLNPDGTMESTGMVDMSLLMGFAKSLGYATDDVDKALAEYHIPKIDMPFYIKGTGSIIDNKVTVNVQSLQAGRVSVPSGILSSNMGRINSFAADVVGRQTGFSAKKWVVEGSKIVFDGTMPETESIVLK